MFDLNNIGVDEVGYGSFAGPLFICALKFFQFPDFKLCDSKKLNHNQRLFLYQKIITIADFQIGIASVEEINSLGLAKAYKLALNRALENMQGKILIDGATTRGVEAVCIVKGDENVPVISAASIVAKVQRDTLMDELDLLYPGYFFSKNKGYGTQEHKKAIKTLGFCKIHRINYKIRL